MAADDPLAGRELLARGREAEVYEWRPGQVLRLLRDPDDGNRLAAVAELAETARSAGVATPATLELVTVAGRRGQVMARVDGVDHFAAMARRPWAVTGYARQLGEVHASLHTVALGATSREGRHRSLHDLIDDRLRSPAVPHDIAAGARRALDALPDDDALCHGDLHPGNVLATADGPVIIDWTGAALGDPMADVARSDLMLRVGAVADGTPTLVRALAGPLRRVFSGRYLAAYARAGRLDRERLAAWTPVRAADRLADEVPEERAALLDMCRPLVAG